MDDQLTCGLELSSVPSLVDSLNAARASGFDYIAAPLAHPRYQRVFSDKITRDEPWTRSDMLLNSYQWGNGVVGKISSWIDLDSRNQLIRSRSEKVFLLPLLLSNLANFYIIGQAFKQEIAWATHLSLSAVLLPTPSYNSVNYARVINQIALNLSYMQAWLRIPLLSPKTLLAVLSLPFIHFM